MRERIRVDEEGEEDAVMSPETLREAELRMHQRDAEQHRRIAERLGSAGFHDLASVHLLEAKLAELNAAATRRASTP